MANWQGATSDFDTASNWSPATVPGSGATGVFGDNGALTSITFSTDTTVGGLSFSAGAPAFNFVISGVSLTLDGSGIVDDSSHAPTLTAAAGGAITFVNDAGAGDAILNAAGGALNFDGNSAGSAAQVTVSGGGLVSIASGASVGATRVTLSTSADSLTTSGTLTASASVSNAGTVLVTGPASFTTPTYANTGATFVDGVLALNAAVKNDGAGQFVINAATTGVSKFTNYSTSATAVGVTGAGSLTATVWVVNAAGAFTNNGTITAPKVDNQAAGTFVTTGAVTAATSVKNEGAMTASGTITTPTLTNSGELSTGGALTINGALVDTPTGTLVVGNPLTATTRIANAGTVLVNSAASITTPTYTNRGATFVNAALVLNAVVRNDGAGQFVINAASTGVSTFANNSTSATAVGITGTGSLAADEVINDSGTFTNNGAITAPMVVNEANGTLITTGAVTASTSVRNKGTMTASGVITTPTLTNSGNFSTGGALTINGALVDAATGTLVVGDALTATTSISNAGLVLVDSAASITTPKYTNTGATFVNAALALNAAVKNNGAGQFVINAAATGVSTFTNNSTSATAVGITGTGSLAANSLVNVAGAFTNNGLVTAPTVDNQAGGTFITTGAVDASTSVTNEGTLTASGTITTPTLTNSGNFSTGGALTINGALVDAVTGSLVVGDALTATKSISNAGIVLVDSPASITTPKYANTGATFVNAALALNAAVKNDGAGQFVINAATTGVSKFINNSTSTTAVGITATGSLAAISVVNKAGTFTNNGTITAAKVNNRADGTLITTGTLTASKSVRNEGQMTASGTIATPKLINSGNLSTGGALTINGALVDAAKGTVDVKNSLTLGQASFDAGSIDVQTGGTLAGAGLTVEYGGALDIAGGTVSAPLTIDRGGDVEVDAGGASSATTIDGGVLKLEVGASESGPIAFSADGGALVVDGSVMPKAEIDGFLPGADAKIDLDGAAFSDKTKAVLLNNATQHNVLQITDANGTHYDLQLDPSADYAGDRFEVTKEFGGTGTVVSVVEGRPSGHRPSDPWRHHDAPWDWQGDGHAPGSAGWLSGIHSAAPTSGVDWSGSGDPWPQNAAPSLFADAHAGSYGYVDISHGFGHG